MFRWLLCSAATTVLWPIDLLRGWFRGRQPGPADALDPTDTRQRRFRTCSWCHRMNEMAPDRRAVFCADCHHRADLPRMYCTCAACMNPPRVTVTREDIEATERSICERRRSA